jgi:hypothetical protein
MWVIATMIVGDTPEDLIGPFDSREAAQDFLDDDRSTNYMTAMAESAVDNSALPLDRLQPEVFIFALNDPAFILEEGSL